MCLGPAPWQPGGLTLHPPCCVKCSFLDLVPDWFLSRHPEQMLPSIIAQSRSPMGPFVPLHVLFLFCQVNTSIYRQRAVRGLAVYRSACCAPKSSKKCLTGYSLVRKTKHLHIIRQKSLFVWIQNTFLWVANVTSKNQPKVIPCRGRKTKT